MKENNPHILGEAPIGKLLVEYSIPAIIGMTLTSLYNIIDSIFIGHGVGALAISGLAITFPLMNLLVAFCTLVGVGGATLSSIRLGQKDKKGAEDILGNVAGTIRRAPFLEHSEEDFDFVMQINLYAPMYLSQAFCRHVVGREGRGKIINICSMLSYQGGILVPGYTASKHGIAGITKLIANEMGAKGINCNGIAPGYIATANTAPIRADAERNKAILDRIPVGRWGDPDDLAGTAVFLASSASDYVNGAIINVDGGWQAR